MQIFCSVFYVGAKGNQVLEYYEVFYDSVLRFFIVSNFVCVCE